VEPIRINPRLRTSSLAAVFRQHRRLHIPDFLDAAAANRLAAHLRDEIEWAWVFNHGATSYDLPPAAQSALTPEQRQQIEAAIVEGARKGFQYSYEASRVADDEATRTADTRLVARFADFLNSRPFLDFASELTGLRNIAHVDAQATRYSAGHFLTAHNDAVPGKNRLAAYVFNLTEDWRPDWGGQLQFIDADGHVAEAYVPKYNALNVFAVPTLHAVSMVSTFAARSRYSITGWLRFA
jgi:Rps23 Pro-64 3,4-dihydroxylase Tpa1-like proline 4-hydroxylase